MCLIFMKKYFRTSFIALFVIVAACSDENPLPAQPEWRAEKMSRGPLAYRLLEYDGDNRVSHVIDGLISDGDSIETRYAVIYSNGNIQRIADDTDSQVWKFKYDDSRIMETREYVDNQLIRLNTFEYDNHGHVVGWTLLLETSAMDFKPIGRLAFMYDAEGNAIKMEYYHHQPGQDAFELVSTTTYEDFDTYKNSGELFLNFSHPYHTLFKNNARTWRVTNTNGAEGVSTYTYEYNDGGYVTRQTESNGLETLYQFSMH